MSAPSSDPQPVSAKPSPTQTANNAAILLRIFTALSMVRHRTMASCHTLTAQRALRPQHLTCSRPPVYQPANESKVLSFTKARWETDIGVLGCVHCGTRRPLSIPMRRPVVPSAGEGRICRGNLEVPAKRRCRSVSNRVRRSHPTRRKHRSWRAHPLGGTALGRCNH